MIYLMMHVFFVLVAAAVVSELTAIAVSVWKRARTRPEPSRAAADLPSQRQPEGV